ncbi:MAG TPA: glycerol-3-phosphate dehydrogenase/oxidase [Acidimicrobiales bacterium]|nr:glycerol-3-phosphate dehydrogenase/oxidase [Acidimicrobiales bacterium]
MAPPPFDRVTALARLGDEHFDVLVIGGGITGAGVALDAASRGLRTALVERGDFASGTSSKSSKLVHGGLRYLQQREYALVYEGLAERQRLRKTAPHLVRVLPFLIPIFSRDGLINPKVARALGSAMWMYDLTGGLRIGKVHKRLDKAEALAHMPTMPADRLASAYLYYDAQADDARLTLTVARTAAAHGAAVASYTSVTRLLKDARGAVTGAVVAADGDEIEVRAKAIVNATGVWADDLRALDEGVDPQSIRPAKGIHITVPWQKTQNDVAVVIPVPKDKRSLFVVPWGDLAYVGTTDTDYDGPIDDPQCTPDDIAYVLRALNASVTTGVTQGDILGTWAGLRPLVKDATSERTADLSRRHAVRRSASGVVTVTGGKLTTYRRMAADTVDEVAKALDVHRRSSTRHVVLLGGEGFDPDRPRSGVDAHLAARYGTEADGVALLAARDPDLARPLVPGLPYVRAEAVHAVRHEMARTLDDVLSRRTRARLLARDDAGRAAEDVAALIAPELGWSEAEHQRQVAEFRESLAHERTSAALPETALDATIGA